MKTRWLITGWLLVCGWLTDLQAQVYTLKPGTAAVLKKGTAFFADSLVLTPMADFMLSYTSLLKSPGVQHPLTGQHIARVYRFCGTAGPFCGAISMYYREGDELMGMDENCLSLDIFNGSIWRIFSPAERNVRKNFVTVNGVSSMRLNELTLVDSRKLLKKDAAESRNEVSAIKLQCRVSPNPSSQQFRVSVSSSSDAPIILRLSDIAGRQIARWNIIRYQNLLVGAELKPGIYLLQALQGEEQQVIRLVKQ